MKKINKRKLVQLSSLALFFCILSFYACKRSVNNETVNNNFGIAEAKEWYYGVFKKTDEYKNQKTKTGLKLPDWKNGRYRKVGNIEIVEFPLYRNNSLLSIKNENSLPNEQLQRIASASLTKVSFIKKANNEIAVRVQDIIPDYDYLQKKNYDISDFNIATSYKTFSGRVITRDWNGEILTLKKIKEGVIKTGTLKKTGTKFSKNATRSSSQSCVIYEVCEYERTCEEISWGDTWIPTGNCTEWIPTGNCYQEEYCEPDGCNPALSESCECQLYGLGCNINTGAECSANEATAQADLESQFDSFTQIEGSDLEEADLSSYTTYPYTATKAWIVVKGGGGSWKVQARTKIDLTKDNPDNPSDSKKTLVITHIETKYVGSNDIVITDLRDLTHSEEVKFNHTSTPIGQAKVTGTIHHKMKSNIKVKWGDCEFTFNIGKETFSDFENSLSVY